MHIRHGAGDCRIHIAAGSLRQIEGIAAGNHHGRRVAVVADADALAAVGSPVGDAPAFTFRAGESSKTRETWSALTDALLAARFDRGTLVVALGGGVATDLGGFVAATLFRGVPWIAVPTTTLGMLDAAIGGKTAVNTPAGKNLVGAFHPPTDVVIDPATLTTLPEPHFRDGLAEAAKHAVTLDRAYGEWITANAASIAARDLAALETLIRRSVELKASIVADDERESGRRAVLNAGHTVAHAIERATDYRISHGQAVAIGLVVETRLGELMGVTRPGTADGVAALLSALRLPIHLPDGVDADAVVRATEHDKKNRDRSVHAALMAAPGEMSRNSRDWTWPVDLDLLRQVLVLG